jgi:SAM-dependent methyltransferase
MAGDAFEYEGRDLEAMAFAPNYHRWIRDLFGDALRGDVAEIGAGTGSFTAALLEANPESLVAVEPASAMHAQHVRRHAADARVESLHGTIAALEARERRYDAIVYNNVLEHVADDRGEMRRARALLKRGGVLLVFSPALPWLMSEFDRSVGHERRYRRHDLGVRAREAGYVVERLHYVDFAGIVPWYLFMVLGRGMLDPRKVSLYDRIVVPVMRRLEGLLRPPIGRNVLLVARNPG